MSVSQPTRTYNGCSKWNQKRLEPATMAADTHTPMASKSTFSSRSKMATIPSNTGAQHHNGLSNNNSARFKSNMPPPSTVARLSSRHMVTPVATSRIASLATGYKPAASASRLHPKPNADKPNAIANPTTLLLDSSSRLGIPVTTPALTNHQPSQVNIYSNRLSSTTRITPHTTSKLNANIRDSSIRPTTTASSSNNFATPKLNGTNSINSRSSSLLSSVSSTTLKRQSTAQIQPAPERTVPETNVLRKGLAKFSNPIECQRQFQTLNLKIRQLNEVREAREKEIDQLQEQLNHSVKVGTAYAITVQYLAQTLKLGSNLTLVEECCQLKEHVAQLLVNDDHLKDKLATIKAEHQQELDAEKDLNTSLKLELQEKLKCHSTELQLLRDDFQAQIDLLNNDHTLQTNELEARVATLQADLNSKTKDLSELTKEHESLNNRYNKLEETLTKDKDARVKYAQEKIVQLQKDVESLNAVLDMKTERIHQLEKDSILLSEVQNELMICKDNNKSLSQQIEAIKATLDTKKEQLENLTVENEKMRIELKRERKERRRMTMRTEQLEYVLNESCSETTMFNSSLRDIDTSDRVV